MQSSRNQKGFTLAEIMVAIAVFAVISAIALTLYNQLQKSFKQGENAAFQQQNTRIAFDRMIADLRMAGFNYNPDGDGARPDEQIEMMWPTAITVRGDYDFETVDATTPESTLGGPGMTFGTVSTGNDEIVTYALGKPSGAGGTTLTFEADVTAVPRDGSVDTVQIPNVYTDSNSPPYTLYRIVVNPSSNTVQKVPVADDIRNLEFKYYDAAGRNLSDPNYPYTVTWGGADTPGGLESRSRVAKIEVKVVGMTKDPDLAYVDPTDTNPQSQNYRKFELSGDVTPRNLGFVGVPDLDLQDPNTPTGLVVCPGHCKGLMTTWNPNPPGGGVVKYEVTYGSGPLSQGNPTDTFVPSLYLDGLVNGTSYVVSVAAVDSAGNKSDPRAYSPPVAVIDTNHAPVMDPNLSPSTSVPNQIDVSWPKPTDNSPQVACDPGVVRDLKGYRMWRGASSGFDPNVPADVQLSWNTSQLPGNMGAPSTSDTSVVNCRAYWYKVQAEDKCGLKSGVAAGSGQAGDPAIPPAAPINTVATDLGLGTALITWDQVTQDTSSPQNSIVIDKYRIWRASVATASDPNLASYSHIDDVQVAAIGAPSYTDTNVPAPPAGTDWYYRVSAWDDCPNESDRGLPALLTSCAFGGTVSLSMSPGGNPVGGTQTINVSVGGGVSTVRGLIRVVDRNNGSTVFSQTFTAPPYTASWNVAATTVQGHSYDVLGAVENTTGCIATDIISGLGVVVSAPCCIVATNPTVSKNTTLGSVGGGVKNNQITFDIDNQCGFDVDIERFRMDWENNALVSPCSSTTANPQLTAWTFTGYPNIILSPPVNPISGSNPRADFDLRNTPFVPYEVLGGTTVSNSFVFTESMVYSCSQPGSGSTIVGNKVGFRYDTSDGQSCFITVIPNPLTLSLCDVNIDPNCP